MNLKLIVMKTNYLFPHQFKKLGWVLFVPGLVLGILFLVFSYEFDIFNIKVFALAAHPFLGDWEFLTMVENNILDELIGVMLIVGALLITFSKEKSEDEYISKIRLESLVWATYVNYFILILAILFVYDMAFFSILVYNMFTVLLIFILRFNWALYKFKKLSGDEE